MNTLKLQSVEEFPYLIKSCGRTRVLQIELSLCFQPQLASLCATSSRGRPASCHRPFPQQELLLQQEADSELHHHPLPQDNPLPNSSSSSSGSSGGGGVVLPAARNAAGDDGSRSSTDSPSVGSVGDTGEITSTTILD